MDPVEKAALLRGIEDDRVVVFVLEIGHRSTMYRKY
jgi:mRNA-degrading endonuclease RelE of RelBE toxin-antitoxin system